MLLAQEFVQLDELLINDIQIETFAMGSFTCNAFFICTIILDANAFFLN